MENWDNYGESFEPYLTGNAVQAPQTYSLEQNYPNPFNPSTTISFTLPQAGQVSLQVYDLQGRLVADLVNGLKDAGSHQITWEASSQASGLYFCRLQAGSFNQVRKMMLVK
jgi:hypothetical protein